MTSLGTLSSFHLWTCQYSLGSWFWAGIICAILPGKLLQVTSMGVIISAFVLGESVLVLRLCGSFMNQVSAFEVLKALGMTPGRHGLMFR